MPTSLPINTYIDNYDCSLMFLIQGVTITSCVGDPMGHDLDIEVTLADESELTFALGTEPTKFKDLTTEEHDMVIKALKVYMMDNYSRFYLQNS